MRSKNRAKITRRRAIKLAIECVESERHKIIFDANMVEQYGITTPYALRCHKKNMELLSVVDFLNNLLPTQHKMEF